MHRVERVGRVGWLWGGREGGGAGGKRVATGGVVGRSWWGRAALWAAALRCSPTIAPWWRPSPLQHATRYTTLLRTLLRALAARASTRAVAPRSVESKSHRRGDKQLVLLGASNRLRMAFASVMTAIGEVFESVCSLSFFFL